MLPPKIPKAKVPNTDEGSGAVAILAILLVRLRNNLSFGGPKLVGDLPLSSGLYPNIRLSST